MYDNTVAQKISKQYNQTPLVNFASVNLNTKLDDLNLNWRERDLPEIERTKHVHRLHTYMGKFIPQLVEIFLRKYHPKLIYDPFCGSGTTLVEANVLGIDAVGTDISVFNTTLSKVKTATYDVLLLEKEVKDILKKFYDFKYGSFKNNGHGHLSTKSEYIKMWFSQKTQKELLYFKELFTINPYRIFLKVILYVF